MAFEKISPRVPHRIGEITLLVGDPDGNNANRRISARVEVVDAGGNPAGVWDGDLRPHLTAQQLNGIAAFLDSLRAQAAAQLL